MQRTLFVSHSEVFLVFGNLPIFNCQTPHQRFLEIFRNRLWEGK